MYDFTAQAVTAETTKVYVFDMIPGAPSVLLAPAHESNPAYLDSTLRLSVETSKKAVREARGRDKAAKPETKTTEQTVTEIKDQLAQERLNDRRCIGEGCIRGWGKAPLAADGSAPEFTPENAQLFIAALPDWMFDALRNYAQNIYNFVDRPPVSEEDARELGN